MTKQFYVIDGENNTIWQGKENDDAPQTFKSFDAAEKRAKEAAGYEPGTAFKIVQVVATVACPVQPAKTTKVA